MIKSNLDKVNDYIANGYTLIEELTGNRKWEYMLAKPAVDSTYVNLITIQPDGLEQETYLNKDLAKVVGVF